MATRSAIVELNSEGQYRGIYCHSDGYPEYNGLMLVEYYNTPEKVKELIDLGSISSLNKRVKADEGEFHSYEKRAKDVTVAYHRDRNDDFEDMQTVIGATLEDVVSQIDCAYVYIFKDGEWYVDDGYENEPVLVKSMDLDRKYIDQN